MLKKLTGHLFAIALVTSLLIVLLTMLRNDKGAAGPQVDALIAAYTDQEFIDVSTPFGRALFNDMLNRYYPGQKTENKKTTAALVQFRNNRFRDSVQKSHTSRRLTAAGLKPLYGMYFKFLTVYVLVMLITFYGVQTFGTYRFIREKQRSEPVVDLIDDDEPDDEAPDYPALAKKVLKHTVKAFLALILFSPAYVIAYAFKTEINTDTVFFMVVLATLTNGLLVTYANRFYTFLVSESRKGYVDTAVVKNLHNRYEWNVHGGIRRRSIFLPFKKFDNHVFGLIFTNARSQYLATLKEQASFLITGLIIIEMALNIHGFLNYEMLRHILYRNYDFVIAIMISIFITVKLTDIATDALIYREEKKYAN